MLSLPLTNYKMFYFYLVQKMFSHFPLDFPFDPRIVYKSVKYLNILMLFLSLNLVLWLGKHFMIQLFNIFKDLCYGRGLVFL